MMGVDAIRQLAAVVTSLRDDTKICLVVGWLVGLGLLYIMKRYPGKPIDYESVCCGGGVDIPYQLSCNKTKEKEVVSSSLLESKVGLSTSSPEVESEGLRKRRMPGHQHQSRVDGAGISDDDDFNIDRDVDEEVIVRKFSSAPKIKGLLGISDEDVRKAVRDAKREMRDGPDEVMSKRKGRNSDGAPKVISTNLFMDIVVYVCLLSLLGYVMCRDYGVTIMGGLRSVFPREIAAIYGNS